MAVALWRGGHDSALSTRVNALPQSATLRVRGKYVVLHLQGGGRKGKENKHTKAELKAKEKAATKNMGGGAEGLMDRKGGEAGHAKFECHVCGIRSPSLTTLKIHHEAKHPKIPFDPEKAQNVHAKYGGSTRGVAVHGTLKNAKKKKKEKTRS
eukprot:CAMPEP_0170173570 /NCGR_PEP_ID=MMETSP0040_2-20121228/6863_1 /TAXON_ID=641309 /ORGANISM="Lotharella oceanica, Strain CCMP622" /LENGTH=152 /DNA_ID=CAMNT_0010414815 /DNA_START=81 /DNA_END=539 /DNA_ORIENTATION=-